jgi:hypothetical protein
MRSGSGWTSVALGLVLTAAFAPPAHAQEMSCYLARGSMEEAAQRPSPLGQTVIAMDGKEARFCYGRPGAKSRTVMGELVPFGQPWRIGANEATALHLPFAAEVGGVDLEAGSYSIYAVPGEEEWTFTLNSNFERWGVPINDEIMATDVGSFTRSVKATEEMVEQLTVSWKSNGEGMGHLVIQWENTSVEIPIHGPGM